MCAMEQSSRTRTGYLNEAEADDELVAPRLRERLQPARQTTQQRMEKSEAATEQRGSRSARPLRNGTARVPGHCDDVDAEDEARHQQPQRKVRRGRRSLQCKGRAVKQHSHIARRDSRAEHSRTAAACLQRDGERGGKGGQAEPVALRSQVPEYVAEPEQHKPSAASAQHGKRLAHTQTSGRCAAHAPLQLLCVRRGGALGPEGTPHDEQQTQREGHGQQSQQHTGPTEAAVGTRQQKDTAQRGVSAAAAAVQEEAAGQLNRPAPAPKRSATRARH